VVVKVLFGPSLSTSQWWMGRLLAGWLLLALVGVLPYSLSRIRLSMMALKPLLLIDCISIEFLRW
jgi:hypothetical protein